MKEQKAIIFFDDDCLMCNSFVNLHMKVDSKKLFYYSSLSSDTASEYLGESNINKETITLYFKDEIFIKSKAIINILTQLPYFGFIFYLLKIVPTSIADNIYDWIARNRYRLGKKDNKNCDITDKLEQSRILK